jgi:hypothetical protein
MRSIAPALAVESALQRGEGLDRRLDAAPELPAVKLAVEALHLLVLALRGGVRKGDLDQLLAQGHGECRPSALARDPHHVVLACAWYAKRTDDWSLRVLAERAVVARAESTGPCSDGFFVNCRRTPDYCVGYIAQHAEDKLEPTGKPDEICQ